MTRRLLADAHPLGTVALLAEAATVTDVDTARRIIEGTVVPYGEEGRTNLGLRAVAAGAVRFRQATDPRVIGLYGHDRERTVSRLAAYEDSHSALRARFRVAATPLGDQLLAEAAEGVRAMLSVELDGVRYDASGNIVEGLCEFVAHVPIGAYDSATVDSVAASLHPENGDDVSRRHLARSRFGREFITVGGGGQPAPAPAAAPPAAAPPAAAPPAAAPAPAADQLTATVAAPAAPAVDLAALAAALAPHLTAAAAPAGLPTGGLTATPAAPAVAPSGADLVAQLSTLQAQQASQGGNDRELRAALADITNSDLPIFQRPAGAIPQELWRTSPYQRRYVPLLTPRPLTSMKLSGWEFVERPQVDDWSGDKTEVPTNEVTTREITGMAQRLAGGWDIDRKFRDFGDSLFWSAFYMAQTESYAYKTDIKAVQAIVAAAQDVTGTADVEGYTRPPGYGTVASQDDVLQAVAFGTAYLEDTPLIYDYPDYVLMNTTDWLTLLKVTNLDLPAFLKLLGVEPDKFLRSPFVPSGSVILGITEALQWYELPGAAPIRVEALDVARGGIDDAVFGYWGTLHTRPGGIISVPLTSAG